MAKTELIDGHVSLKQCKRAVAALHDYATKKEKEREEKELLPGKDEHIWLQITVKRMQPIQKLKPVRIPLKHTLVDPRTSSFISRVVGIEKLRGKFKAFEARRLLLKENAMFLADDRVIPLLPRLLGSKWFEAKKQPIPVNLKRKNLKAELELAIESSYMHQNKGTCTSVKVGVLSQTPKQILANIQTALPAIASRIKDGWENIQCLHIKTSSSISLPIWSCELSTDAGGRWAGLTIIEPEDKDGLTASESEEEDDMSVDETQLRSPSPPPPKKTRKSSSAATPDQPSKKHSKVSTPSANTPSAADQPSRKKEKFVKIVAARTDQSKKPSSPSPVTTISHEEVKIKRSADVGEKKKVKVVKGTISKTSKDTLLGKNVKTSTATPIPVDQPPKKKDRPAKNAEARTGQSTQASSPPPAATISQKEVKSKRNAEVGEKKKGKVVKGRIAKSPKDKLLGKKAGKS
ncbi:ribosomal protein L1p/L10e family-domain-containing protein [Pisolithus albus]|nr:ribosomal protein L1p/L10e family-domain-containing protein [Pisolithus albus]